jgi:tetratricopeptide (TPR) repeat protein
LTERSTGTIGLDETLAAASVAGPQLGRGASLGRYIVLDVLGGGGMGVVYAAYDPELDRRVAIKLLHSGGGHGDTSEGRARLLREAQAIARIAHPNVVGVHDVGTVGDEVFVAMEHVEGRTLRAWLAERKRTPEEILAMFVQAGRGLSAAHAKGLVHRDFKPDNVLVGTDGRARVLDFGLAHAVGDKGRSISTRPPPPPSSSRVPPSSPLLETPLTRTGELMGTPLYMSPEQYLGKAVDARTDQYSFSVALLEALHGEHPIVASVDVDDLRRNVLAGELRDEPDDRRLPPRLRRTLARGMAVDVAARFESMDALLAELEPGKPVRTGLWALALAVVVATGGVVLWRRAAADPMASCLAGTAELAGAWGADRKAAMTATFGRSTRPYAPDALRLATEALDGYAARWSTMRQQACVATRVTGEQSAELLDLRMACLGRRRDELRALVDAFVSADDGIIEHAAQASLSLPDVAACADVTALRAPAPMPRDPATVARIDAVRAQLTQASALAAAGKYADLVPIGESATREASAIGYAPLQAEAEEKLGEALTFAGNSRRARDAYFEAVLAAEAGRDDHVAAEAWIRLTRIRSYLSEFEQAHASDRLSGAAIVRLGGDDALTARRQFTLASLLHVEGRYSDALAQFGDALEATRRALGDQHPDVANVIDSTGQTLIQLGRYDEAIAAFERALVIRERALGPAHPLVAAIYEHISHAYEDKGDFQGALEYAQRSIAIKEPAMGPDHPLVASPLVDEANALDGLGRFDEAIAAYQRALAIRERNEGPSATSVSDVVFNLAQTYGEQGQPAQALPFAQRALSIREASLGPDHPEVGAALSALGDLMCEAGRCADSVPLQERALAIAQKAYGPDHVQTAEALRGLGRAKLGTGDPGGAREVLERAYALFQKVDDVPSERAECGMLLARAVWATGDRGRARTLAEEARAIYAAAGPQVAQALQELQAWQRAHGVAPTGR